jgi:glycosyltransferase involved in cell wall biosynthesis
LHKRHVGYMLCATPVIDFSTGFPYRNEQPVTVTAPAQKPTSNDGITPRNRPFRALHLGKYYPPHHGGMETYLRDLLGALQQLGVKSSAVVHRSNLGLRSTEDVINPDNEQPRIVRAAVWATVLFAPLSPAFPLQLRRLIREVEPDLLHIHMPNLSAFWALLLPSARKLPWVVHWHADVPLSEHNWALRLIYRCCYRPLERLLLQRATAIIATSPPYRDYSPQLQQFREKTAVVPLGLRPPDPPVTTERSAEGSPLRLIAIGRLTYYKGFSVLLRTLARCSEVTLDLVGAGSEHAALERLAVSLGVSDRVRLHGALHDQEVLALLTRADALCLPSIERTEAFGMVLLEAMAQGKACVATAVPGTGMAWVIQHGETGLTVPPNDIEALAAALTTLARDRQLTHRLGSGGKARFEDNFRIERSAAGILATYRQLFSR